MRHLWSLRNEAFLIATIPPLAMIAGLLLFATITNCNLETFAFCGSRAATSIFKLWSIFNWALLFIVYLYFFSTYKKNLIVPSLLGVLSLEVIYLFFNIPLMLVGKYVLWGTPIWYSMVKTIIFGLLYIVPAVILAEVTSMIIVLIKKRHLS